jgi:hypothetical protein
MAFYIEEYVFVKPLQFGLLLLISLQVVLLFFDSATIESPSFYQDLKHWKEDKKNSPKCEIWRFYEFSEPSYNFFKKFLRPKNRLILISFYHKLRSRRRFLGGKNTIWKIITRLRDLVKRSNFTCGIIFLCSFQ